MPVVLGEDQGNFDRYQYAVTGELRMVSTPRELYNDLELHNDEDLVIVGPDVDISIAVEVADRYRTSRPALGVVLVRRRLEVSILNQAMRAGIREVVSAEDSASLAAACQRSRALSRDLLSQSGDSGPTKKGEIIIVFSAKGGCGKTTVSTNLAEALHQLTGSRIALVDFDLQFGDVGVALQLDPVQTVSDAIGMQYTMDAAGISSLMVPYKDSFDVLLAPLNPTDVEHVSGELAHKILTLLQEQYDYVVVDSPPAFTEVVLRTFDLAEEFLLLTTLDMPAIKNLKVTIDTLDALGMPRDKWKVIINRADSRLGLKPEDVEEAIGIQITEKIPTSNDVPACVNSGVTIMAAKPTHEVSQAFIRLAKLMAPEVSKTKNGVSGLLNRVKRKP